MGNSQKTKIANNFTKGCSTSLITKKMEIKTQIKPFHAQPIGKHCFSNFSANTADESVNFCNHIDGRMQQYLYILKMGISHQAKPKVEYLSYLPEQSS